MQIHNSARTYLAVLTITALTSVSHDVSSASASTTYVANNGVDSTHCGARDAPCRSITQALANAPSGGTIIVGPGHYGDIDGDGRFESPGDERPQRREYTLTPGGWPRELSCVVCITKPIRLLSWDGAAATVIDAGGASYHVVQITANNVLFGDVDRGFTLTGAALPTNFAAGGSGLTLHGAAARIIGNVARSNAYVGFDLAPGGEPPVPVSTQWHTTQGRVLAAHNLAVDNLGGGIILYGFNPVTLDGNTVTGNGRGVAVGGFAPNVVTHTMVSGNASGILVNGGPFQFTHNIVTANNDYGFHVGDRLEILAGTNVFHLNDVIGNGGPGFFVDEATVGVEISQNNIYGNGFIDGSNCGVAVFHNAGDARNNYWGSRNGPGKDPADQVGMEPHCDGTIPPGGEAGLPATKPFATQPFGVL
jgi:parallel beta-helix repeat protein